MFRIRPKPAPVVHRPPSAGAAAPAAIATPDAPLTGDLPRENLSDLSHDASSGGWLSRMGAFVGHEHPAVSAVVFGAIMAPSLLVAFAAHADTVASQPTGDSTARDLLYPQNRVDTASAPRPSKAAPSAEEKELASKIAKLVTQRFGGDYRAAFDHYDADHDGAIDSDELGNLLSDAGIGNLFTRGAWVDGIIKKLDGPPGGNRDGQIQWAEFQKALHH